MKSVSFWPIKFVVDYATRRTETGRIELVTHFFRNMSHENEKQNEVIEELM